MHSPLKKFQKNKKEDIDQQLFNTIYKKVTAENYQENQDETFKECKRLFKQGASPKTLAKLENILRERQDEQTITKQLKLSKPGNSPKSLAELEKSVKKKREHYNNYTQRFLPALKAKITKSKKLNPTEKTEIEKIIMKLITLDVVSKSSSVSSIPNAVEENIEDQMQLKHIEEQNNTQETPLNVAEKKSGDNKILSNSDVTEEVFEKYSKVVEEIDEKQTSKLSSGNDSDSGMGSRELSVTRTSSEESVNLTLNPVEEKKDPQTENKKETILEHPTKTRPKEPSGQRSPSIRHGKIENQLQTEQVVKEELKLNSEKSGSTLPGKEELKLEEQKKEAVLSEQSAPDNNNNDKEVLSKKQPNNRNLHVALVAGCALLAVGCLVAAAIARSGILCVIGAVFAIAAMTTWCLTPSSELTSTNLSRPVDDKELTACSHL
ncbi:hypothetical protein [Wolbachia endosymbiont (group A) of Myopa testacea]|uniref:hypothetical protein n=1 Tax=Wolbachia endosymbiont (group A) of Myopa testacea TaxID=3066148 RepID=UPI003132EE70